MPDPGDEDLLATVSFSPVSGEEGRQTELFRAIARRRTYRKRFESKQVPSEVLGILEESAETEGAWFQVLESEHARHQVAELVAEGDAAQWSNPSWRRELAAWMHPRRKGDGLTVPGMVAPVAQLVVRTFDMGNGVGAKDRQLADESPVIAALGTAGDGVEDWLKAGQALERVLLRSLGQGLQASYLNQPIQVAVLRPKLQHLLGRSGFPQILLRLGYRRVRDASADWSPLISAWPWLPPPVLPAHRICWQECGLHPARQSEPGYPGERRRSAGAPDSGAHTPEGRT